jgi:hypothetical protein
MRVAQNEQMTIGEVDISNIRFDPKSRDDIPKILRGLQFIYTHLRKRSINPSKSLSRFVDQICYA